MQISLDLERVMELAGEAIDWHTDKPVRLLIPYLAMTLAIGYRYARKTMSEVYEDIRKGKTDKNGIKACGAAEAVCLPAIVCLTAPAWVPIAISWRIFRAGKGPIPKPPDQQV